MQIEWLKTETLGCLFSTEMYTQGLQIRGRDSQMSQRCQLYEQIVHSIIFPRILLKIDVYKWHRRSAIGPPLLQFFLLRNEDYKFDK